MKEKGGLLGMWESNSRRRKDEWRGMKMAKVYYVLLLRRHNKTPYYVQLIYKTVYKDNGLLESNSIEKLK